MLEECEEAAPVLHLTFSLGQIYGSKLATENRLYNQEMERDLDAARVFTAGIINLITSKSGNNVTAAKFKGKNQGLSTTVTCHSNFSMTEDKPVVMCTSGDYESNGQPRVIMRGNVGSYYDMNKKVMRSVRMEKQFLPHSIPSEVVNQSGSLSKTGTSVMIKTSTVHFNKSERVIKEVDPAEVMKNGDLDVYRAALTNKSVIKKIYDYICSVIYEGGEPQDLEQFNKDIITHFLPHMDGLVQSYRVKEEFTRIITSGGLVEEMDYYEEEVDDDYDMFDCDDSE